MALRLSLLTSSVADRFSDLVNAINAIAWSAAAHACHALCRARVVEELQRRRRTRIGEHLKLVLIIIDRQEH